MNAVGNLRHERLGKAKSPAAIMVFDHGSVGKASRVGSIVIGTIVVDSPVRELKIAVGAVRIHIEKIGHAELTETQFQAALWKLGEQREGSPVGGDLIGRESDDLVPHEPCHI